MKSRILHGDCREVLRDLPAKSVHCVVTSPPYWGLRSYGGDEGMIGLEPTFEEHLVNLVAVFREVRRVLRDDGTLWLNYGDAYSSSPPGNKAKGLEKWKTSGLHGANISAKYAETLDNSQGQRRDTIKGSGLKAKDLLMMPARVAMALRSDGWYLRSKIIWEKPNPMPESVTDRPTSAYEELFLLTKSARYFYDADAVRTPIAQTTVERDKYGYDHSATAWGSSPGHHGNNPTEKRRGQYSKAYQGVEGKDFADTGAQDARSVKSRIVEGVRNGTITGANLRNVWTIPTHSYKGAHFATFPPALVEPCIKAGTSERGVCGECGAPWKRVVGEKTPTGGRGSGNKELQHQGDRGLPDGHANSARGCSIPWQPTATATTGWAPTCEHYDDLYREMSRPPRRARKRQQRAAWPGRWQRVRARPGGEKWETVAATVCDPFAGSGTAGEVSLSLGRSFVGVEINAEYVAMGKRRTGSTAPLFTEAVDQ